MSGFTKLFKPVNNFKDHTTEGLQPVLQQSTICPWGSHELCEAIHGFAKSTQGFASIYSAIKLIDATSCVVLRSHVWREPIRRIVDCCTTAWSPSTIVDHTTQFTLDGMHDNHKILALR